MNHALVTETLNFQYAWPPILILSILSPSSAIERFADLFLYEAK